MQLRPSGETPAEKVVRLLGVKRIAAACDLTANAVWKWKNAKGGTIPSKHQPAILRLAKERGVELTAEDVIGAP